MSTVEQLARVGHGAIQIEEAKERPYIIFLGGPIKHWWTYSNDDWMTGAHKEYVDWRDAVETAFVTEGFLVYKPHAAWRGSWYDDAESVNFSAILICSVFVNLTPENIPAKGTTEEEDLAKRFGKTCIALPPGAVEDIDRAVDQIKALTPYRPSTEWWKGSDNDV